MVLYRWFLRLLRTQQPLPSKPRLLSSEPAPYLNIRLLAPRYWPTWILLLFWRSLLLLPWEMRLAVGATLGDLIRLTARRRVSIARANIAACAAELKPKADLERKLFRNLGISMAEAATGWWGKTNFVLDKNLIAQPQGIEILQEFHRQGRGVLLLPLHYSCIELMPEILNPGTSLPLCYIPRPQNNALIDAVMHRGRMRRCEYFADRDPWSMARALRQGQICCYFVDQDYGRKSSVFSDFFGVPAATSILGRKIARRVGAASVLAHFYRKDGQYHCQYLNFPEYLEAESDQEATDLVHRKFEEMIRRVPDQWLWVHRRFKTRPEGGEHIYSGRMAKH